ncbi:unnamed protein product [Prorocentrum cordatum]|uniref:Uncharacterized protein n=1 Tax=Prorocentrum cordatum TaxID=2364126 RepID=A0ABN9SBN4_9DINO|nr:unnamed protein product [Polarella glacialis]
MGREEACTQRYRKSRGPATAETTPKSPLRLPEAGVGYRMRPRSRGGGRDRGEEEVSSRRGARGATRAEPAAKRSVGPVFVRRPDNECTGN